MQEQPTTDAVGVDKAQEGAEDVAYNVSLSINRSELMSLAENGKDLLINPKAEDAIIKLLELQEAVENTIDLVKSGLAEAGLALDPDFSTAAADRLKVNYQYSGAVYKLQKGRKEYPAPLFKREVKVSIDSKEMKKYEEQHRRLPKFVTRNERKRNIQFKVKEG